MYSIVIADDERIIREGISATLKNYFESDVEILTAKDGKEALSIILEMSEKRDPPDVVITDIVMPGMDGLELIKQCNENSVSAEFLILSSYDDFKFAQTAIKQGVDDYILKPCKPEDLIRITKAALDKADKKKHVWNQIPRAKQNLIHDFLHKQNQNQNKDQIYEMKTHFSDMDGTFRIFSVEDCLSDKTEAMKHLLTEALEHDLEESMVYIEKDSLFLITKNIQGRQSDTIYQELQQLLENSGITNPSPVFISSSKEAEFIPELFEQLCTLMETKLYFENKYTVYADNIQISPIDTDFIIKESTLRITDAIQRKDEAAISKEMKQLMKILEGSCTPLKDAKDLFWHIQYSVCGDRFTEQARNLQQAVSIKELKSIFEDIIMMELKGFHIQKYSKPIQTMVDYIEKHLSENRISLQKLASETAFMNSDYLGKLFKKETGYKFSDYLLEKRIEKAKQLLTETHSSIQQIAEQTGFEDNPSYFCQLFKKATGQTPGQFRQH
ncbi:MAG: response regulator [Treponemataceae bacterium]|nr:response regulator [Treponemataceae bacterium]